MQYIQKKPDLKVAYKELQYHLLLLGGFCAAVRLAPYVLSAVQGSDRA